MKWFKKGLIILILIFISTNVMANECYEVTYYSKKEWVTYFDFFDRNFVNATQMTNSHFISANFNGFGIYSFNEIGHEILGVSLSNFDGTKPLIHTATKEVDDFYTTFYITFGTQIRLYDFDFALEVRDENNNLLDINIFVQTANGKELIYEGKNKGIENINLKAKEISAIYFRAKKPRNGLVYTLKYLKFNKYDIYEHTAWVREYIPNTETFSQRYCDASGNYYPNEMTKWVKNQKTIFTPKLSIINDNVKYQLIDSWLRYNDGWSYGISKEAIPDIRNLYLWNGGDRKLYSSFGYLPINKPFVWKKNGNVYVGMQNDSEFIDVKKTSNNRKVYIKVKAYMVNCANGDCRLKEEGGGKVLYHTNTIRDNAYDTYVDTYVGQAVDELNYISKVEFYLCDENGNRQKLLSTLNKDLAKIDLEKEASEFTLIDSGKWKIEACMENPLKDKASIYSGLFYIDNEAPIINFTPKEVKTSKEAIEVKISVSDLHSGIDKWRYQISNDNAKSFKEYSSWYTNSEQTITINDSGNHIIKVDAIDKAGNSISKLSLVYKIDNEPPILIIKDNVYYLDEEITDDNLKENASAFDSVDGDISKEVEIKKIEYDDGSIAMYPKYLDTSKAQIVKITYSVTNSNNLTSEKIKEYPILDNGEHYYEINNKTKIYPRFIKREYLSSLDANSIWDHREEYKRILHDSLNKNSGIKYIIKNDA